MDLGDEKQLEHVVSVIEKSYGLIREAITSNEGTGWYAESGEDNGLEESEADCYEHGQERPASWQESGRRWNFFTVAHCERRCGQIR